MKRLMWRFAHVHPLPPMPCCSGSRTMLQPCKAALDTEISLASMRKASTNITSVAWVFNLGLDDTDGD